VKRYAILSFLLLLFSFLMAEESEEYEKDEWNNEKKEAELFNIVETQEENKNNTEKDDELSNKSFNNYFTKMYVEGIFNWTKKQSNNSNFKGKINSYILASYYEAFLSFSYASENSLALRFSPVLMHYPKKHISPVLSLYLGSFNTPTSFQNIYKPYVSSITTTSNRKFFPPLNAIKISKNNFSKAVALEISLPFFNYYSFWKNTKKGNIFNFYLSYKNNFSNSSRINIAFISSIQEIKKEKVKKNPYIQIYGLDFNFDSPFFYINSLSAFTVLPKRLPSFSSFALKSEAGLTSHLASLHTGISYKGANYLGNQNLKSLLQRKAFLSFYLQGKLKYKIFRLNGMYHLFKDYKLNKTHHFYGIFYSLGNSFISYKNELLYEETVYKIKFALNITPNINYLKSFNISSFLYLEDKKINLKCIKKYEISSKCGFNIAKNFNLNFSFVMMQEKKNWKKITFFTSTAVIFNFAQEKTKEKGEVKLKYNSKNNKFEIDVKLRIEY